MKRAFSFVENLDRAFLEVCGNPTIKVESDYTEIYFDVAIMRSFKFFDRGDYDSIRVFSNGDLLTLVYTFSNE